MTNFEAFWVPVVKVLCRNVILLSNRSELGRISLIFKTKSEHYKQLKQYQLEELLEHRRILSILTSFMDIVQIATYETVPVAAHKLAAPVLAYLTTNNLLCEVSHNAIGRR